MAASPNQHAPYYRCSLVKREGKAACGVHTNYRAEPLEDEVFGWVSMMVSQLARLEKELDREIELVTRGGGSGDLEAEARRWLRQIEDLEARRARALDLAVDGLMDRDTLRQKLSELDEQKETAEAELAACRDRRGRVEDLEALKEELLVRFMLEGPAMMARWTPQQRHDLYRRLSIMVFALPDGGVEIEGVVELELDRSAGGTTYTAGTRRRRSRRRSPPSRTSCGPARSATWSSRTLRPGRS